MAWLLTPAELRARAESSERETRRHDLTCDDADDEREPRARVLRQQPFERSFQISREHDGSERSRENGHHRDASEPPSEACPEPDAESGRESHGEHVTEVDGVVQRARGARSQWQLRDVAGVPKRHRKPSGESRLDGRNAAWRRIHASGQSCQPTSIDHVGPGPYWPEVKKFLGK